MAWRAEVTSTNTELIDAARAGAGEQVMIADYQSTGRGRRARTWSAPPASSLMISALLRTGLTPATTGHVTFALGLGAIDACQLTCGVRPTLKWPNDLVHEDLKLAGILAESVIEGSDIKAVVVGMGLNTNWPELPAELADVASSLNLLAGRPVDRAQLAFHTLDRFEYWLGAHPDHLLANYEVNSATIGREVQVELPAGILQGVATGVDPAGHLIVNDGTESHVVSVGDVVHLRPVTEGNHDA